MCTVDGCDQPERFAVYAAYADPTPPGVAHERVAHYPQPMAQVCAYHLGLLLDRDMTAPGSTACWLIRAVVQRRRCPQCESLSSPIVNCGFCGGTGWERREGGPSAHEASPSTPAVPGVPIALCTCGEKIIRQPDGTWVHFGEGQPYETMTIGLL